jgi:methylenetetrahydrofolate dehydrogenase (NADP+)/methenyltetrahydrofolate cyclohydrolase/formyltetrahydrofolate synthetase
MMTGVTKVRKETATAENLELLDAGAANVQRQITSAKKAGIPVVVAINRFKDDTDAEVALIKTKCMEAGAAGAVMSNHWAEGGAGAAELAQMVVDVCAQQKGSSGFKFLYELAGTTIKQKIETIAIEVYGELGSRLWRRRYCFGAHRLAAVTWVLFVCGCAHVRCWGMGRDGFAGADGVDYSPEAEEKIETYTRLGYSELPICMAKTHLSFSADPKLKGAPTVRARWLSALTWKERDNIKG